MLVLVLLMYLFFGGGNGVIVWSRCVRHCLFLLRSRIPFFWYYYRGDGPLGVNGYYYLQVEESGRRHGPSSGVAVLDARCRIDRQTDRLMVDWPTD